MNTTTPKQPKRKSWHDAFRARYAEFCRSRGLPAQETEAGLRAARGNAKRVAERHAREERFRLKEQDQTEEQKTI